MSLGRLAPSHRWRIGPTRPTPRPDKEKRTEHKKPKSKDGLSQAELNTNLNEWFRYLSEQHPEAVTQLENGAQRLQLRIPNGPTLTMLKDNNSSNLMVTWRIPDSTRDGKHPQEEVVSLMSTPTSLEVDDYIATRGQVTQKPPLHMTGENSNRIQARALEINSRLFEHMIKNSSKIIPVSMTDTAPQASNPARQAIEKHEQKAKPQIPPQLLEKYLNLAGQYLEKQPASDLSDPTQSPKTLAHLNIPDIHARVTPHGELTGYHLTYSWRGKNGETHILSVQTDEKGKIQQASITTAKRSTQDVASEHLPALAQKLTGLLQRGTNILEERIATIKKETTSIKTEAAQTI